MDRKKAFMKKTLAGVLAAVMAVGGGFTGLGKMDTAEAADQPTLTVDMTDTTGDIMHGAAGFLYGVSSEDVPTTNTMVPLKPKVLCTKGALGTEHPYGDALDVAKTFLESGGQQVMMYNSNYYGVFGVSANYQDYAKVLKDTIAPAVVEWKNAWKNDHQDDNLSDIDIDKAIVYIPINEGTPIVGTGTSEAWQAYYEAIHEADPDATIAGPNSAAYNAQFSEGQSMKSYIQYCADNNCMPDVITWHDLQVDKLNALSGEIVDFKKIWKNTDWKKYNQANQTGGVPEIPQICINEYADFSDCGVPGRLVNWIARLEDEKVYGCLPFWHQANNLNDLTADANEGNGAWWLYKWYGDMSGQTLKVETNTSYDALYGVASIDEAKQSSTVLLGGIDGAANVNLKNASNTEIFKDQTKVHVKVQSTAFSGYHGAQNSTPVILEGTYPVNEDGSVTLSLGNMKFSTAYNVTVTKASEDEKVSDSMVNVYQKVYEAEESGLENGCVTRNEGYFNPRYYLSAGNSVEMPQDAQMTYNIQVPVDGKYKLDFIYGNGTGSMRNDMAKHNPRNVTQSFTLDGQTAQEVVMENTLLENMTGINTQYVDLTKGTHTITVRTTGEGTVYHDALTVTWNGAMGQDVTSENDRYEAENSDFNILLSNKDTEVRTENKLSGYSSNGYVTGLEKRSVAEGGGIRWNVVVEESGLYNMSFNYASKAAGNLNVYIGNTTKTLNNLEKTLTIENTDDQWNQTTASIYLQKGINIVDVDADCAVALDYIQVKAVSQEGNQDVIEAENCIPEGSDISTAESAGASGGKYVVGMEGSADAANDQNKYLEIKYNAPQAGTYQMRILQSNNDICGSHSYNTKIIDKFASVQVNEGEAKRYFFINTFSDDTFKEKTITVNLQAGENSIKVFNDDSWHVLWGGSTSEPGTNELKNYAPNFDCFIFSPLTTEEPIAVPEEYGIQLITTTAGYATVDKNVVEKGGSFQVTIAPEKGLEDVIVNGESKKDQAVSNEDGTYTLNIENVQSDTKVQIYFSEASGEHLDQYITNAGFGTGTDYGWTNENGMKVEKNTENSYEGYYLSMKDGVLSQNVEKIPEGKYTLSVYSKKTTDNGTVTLSVNGKEKEIPSGKEYVKNTVSFDVDEQQNAFIEVKGKDLNEGVYLDNFAIEKVEERDPQLVSQDYEYFVDCGDHNPDTLSQEDKFGKYNGVTDQIYGEDIRTGYSWGVVTTEADKEIAKSLGSEGAYTTYQRPNSNQGSIADGQAKTTSFRYAHGQDSAGINPRYIKYCFELEPGTYQVSVCMGNTWGNSGNPDVYAGDKKLNENALNIQTGKNQEVSGTVDVSADSTSLDVYALSQEATINMNYIKIQKIAGASELNSLNITKQPDKVTYKIGEALSTAGLEIEAGYTDGSSKPVDLKDCEISGFDSTAAGRKTITVKYTENGIDSTITFEVNVEAPLTGIEISKNPDKVEYEIGQEFSTEGMEVSAVYENGDKKALAPEEYTVDSTDFDSSVIGEKVIRITYNDDPTKTAEFSVNVKMAVDKTSLKMAITLGESLEEQQEKYANFEAGSYAALQEALDAARETMENDQADQETVDQIFFNLIDACNELTDGVQKYGLQAAIQGAQNILSDETALNYYDPAGLQELRDVVAAAEQIYNNEESSQEAVNESTTNVIQAVTSLLAKNTTRLNELINMAEKIMANSEKYTSDSIQNLETALQAAKAEVSKEQINQDKINECYVKLTEAIGQLKFKGNKAELENALKNAQDILKNKNKYMADSIVGLDEIVSEAKRVSKNPDAQQDEINDMVKKVIDACLKARLKGDVDLNGCVDTSDSAMLLKYDAEMTDLTEEQLKIADVNEDGASDTADASKILQYSAETITSF